MHISPLIAFLLQVIVYLLLWLWNDYLATMIGLSCAAVAALIFFATLIVEWIEPTRISRSYFWYMGLTIVAPLMVLAAMYLVSGATWTEQ